MIIEIASAVCAGVIMIVGLAAVFSGVRQIRDRLALDKVAVAAPGIVVDTSAEEKTNAEGHVIRYRSVLIEFATPDGRKHRFWEPGRQRRRSRVTVFHDVADPGKAAHRRASYDVWSGLTMVIVGAVFTGTTAFYFVNR